MAKSHAQRLQFGLFSREQTSLELNSEQDFREFFSRVKPREQLVTENIEVLRAQAHRWLIDEGFRPDDIAAGSAQYPKEGNAALAAQTLTHIHVLEGARRDGRTDDAIHEAMMAVQRWMELRANIFFEASVRERETRDRKRRRKVTHDQIVAALSENSSLEAAAHALDISVQALRKRMLKYPELAKIWKEKRDNNS